MVDRLRADRSEEGVETAAGTPRLPGERAGDGAGIRRLTLDGGARGVAPRRRGHRHRQRLLPRSRTASLGLPAGAEVYSSTQNHAIFRGCPQPSGEARGALSSALELREIPRRPARCSLILGMSRRSSRWFVRVFAAVALAPAAVAGQEMSTPDVAAVLAPHCLGTDVRLTLVAEGRVCGVCRWVSMDSVLVHGTRTEPIGLGAVVPAWKRVCAGPGERRR
jgi:hypothetical protein